MGFDGFDRDVELFGDLGVGHPFDFAFDKNVASFLRELFDGVEDDFAAFGVDEFEFGEWVLDYSDEEEVAEAQFDILFVLSVFPEPGYAVVVYRFV